MIEISIGLNLIFFSQIFVTLVVLSVYSVVAEEAPKAEEQAGAEAARVKKHAYIAARKYNLL